MSVATIKSLFIVMIVLNETIFRIFLNIPPTNVFSLYEIRGLKQMLVLGKESFKDHYCSDKMKNVILVTST